jgi:hypothetical protein
MVSLLLTHKQKLAAIGVFAARTPAECSPFVWLSAYTGNPMPPVTNPAATIPYEIASDIEYAERRLASFDKWAFNDRNRAMMGIINAVDSYGRVWGKLAGRQGFSLNRGRPYAVHIGLWVKERLPEDVVVAKAIEVASALAEFEANPLTYPKGDKEALRRELLRKDGIVSLVKALGDLVRDRVQKDYVRLQPGDWVRVSFGHVVGRVTAIGHCRVRATTAERLSSFGHAREHHRYTSWDLVRNTLEKIPPPEPLPLCMPGLEWFQKVVEEYREFEFYAELSKPHLLQMHTHAQQLEFAVNMLFLSDYPSKVDITSTRGLTVFPEELSTCFPDWMKSKLRRHYELTGQLGEHARLLDPPPWEQAERLIQALLELGKAMIDVLAPYIASQVGRETGAKLEVGGGYIKIEGEELLGTPDEEFVDYVWRRAIVVSYSGRTLTVEFDPDEDLPGLHEVDITDVRA